MALPKKQLREKLENLTPENIKETMEWILDGNSASLEALREERDTYKEKADAADQLARERDDYKAKYESAGDASKVQADFDAYKQRVEAEKAHAMDDADLLDIAKEAGVQRASFQGLIARDFDRKKIQRGDDGKVSNRAELVEAIKTCYPDCVASINMDGTPPTNPPPGPAKVYTREQIKTMSPEEINKNWDAISKSLATLK